MSNKQISGLPAASRNALDTDQIAIDDTSNISKKLTALELKNYVKIFIESGDLDVNGNITSNNFILNTGGALRTSTIDTNTLLFQAYDVDGAAFTTFATLTAGNIPTMTLSGDVTGITQAPNDNSIKLATTAYVDAAVLIEDLWDRIGTTVSPKTAGDNIEITGVDGGNAINLPIGAGAASGTRSFNTTLDNTQSNALVAQSISLGTSALGHVGISVSAPGASTSQKAFNASMSAGTGIGYYASSSGAATGFKIVSTSTSSTQKGFSYTSTQQSNSATVFYCDVSVSGSCDPVPFYANVQSSQENGNRITDMFSLFCIRPHQSGIARTDNFNMMYVKRNVSGTASFNQGTVLKLENISSGITDTVVPLQILQSANSTGLPIGITQNAVVSTNFRKIETETNTGITRWYGDGTDPNGTLPGTVGDFLINGLNNRPAYCTGTTNWSDLATEWGDIRTAGTGPGLTHTIGNSAGAGVKSFFTDISNIQSNAIIGHDINLGTSAVGHIGINITAQGESSAQRGIVIAMGGGSGTGIDISGNDDFKGIVVTASTNDTNTRGFQYINNQNNARGTAFEALSTANTVNDFKMFNGNIVSGGATILRATNVFDVDISRSSGFSGTLTDNYDLMSLKRTSASIGGATTFNIEGAVLKLENVATQTAGTLNDNVIPLEIVQNANSTGEPISITQNAVVSTNFRKIINETNSGVTHWMGDGTDPNGTLSGTAGDVLFNGLNNQIYYCTGTTNWSSSQDSVWNRITGTPNYVIPATVADDIGATGVRITKGWLTDLEITNMPTVGGTSINANGALSLTSAEVTQLANIDTTTISTTQWGYLGNLDQDLWTIGTPQFNGLVSTGDINFTANNRSFGASLGANTLTICGATSTVDIPGVLTAGSGQIGDGSNYTNFASDGIQTMVGTARVKKHIVISVENTKLGSSAPTAAIIGNFSVLQFTGVGVTVQSVLTSFHIPPDWTVGTDITVHYHWAPVDGNAGNVLWQMIWDAVASDVNEVISDAGTPTSVVDATQTLQDELLESGNMTISGASLALEDTIGMTIFRDPADALDTYGSSASLVFIEISYISDKLGEAT